MRKNILKIATLLLLFPPGITSNGQENAGAVSGPGVVSTDYRTTVDRAVEFLRVRGQAEDGSFSKQNGLGVSALVAAGLLAVDVPREDPVVAKVLAFIEGYQQPDGGIYAPGSKHSNYETCLAIMAISKANRDGKYTAMLAKAEVYIKKLQWDEGEGLTSDDPAFGGAGYGSKSRPDLSNSSFLLDALNSLGRDGSDEAVQRALIFVSRCQNRASGDNPTPFANKINDGGFYYTPAAGGDSMAGKTENGGLRSYASMTYAGLKSMIFAGVAKDDQRVQAAAKFLESNYSLESNPGMGSSGLFYYYHTMAKALNALGVEQFKAVDGEHAWRTELLATLASSQKKDGSWVNPDSRWLEGDPNLVTGYALLTLSMLKPSK
ncbi:MAG: prenyltransferase/squalene oxidase repeat-containing protein [Pirellulaceae bacterium]|nr:prenyltransferase/squalene oxidase repeat-containing protein [Pirellulaceae bacterium]